MNTIYILWLRQLKRYIRSKSRIIGSLGQPILFLVALGFGLGPIYKQGAGGDYIAFLAPGVIGMSILFTAIFSGIEIIWDKQFGFLKETLVAPVSRVNIMLGRTLGGATVATMQGIIVFILSLFVGFRPLSFTAVPIAIVIMFMVAIIFTALGTAIASFLDDMQGFQLIMNFLVMPLFFLSGAIFPLKGLPLVIDWIAKIDPLSYGVDALRGILTGVYSFSISTDLIVIIVMIVVVLGLGTHFFKKIEI